MTSKVSDGGSQPALVFDKIHFMSAIFAHHKGDNTPFQLRVNGTYYSLGEDGVTRTYSGKMVTAQSKNVLGDIIIQEMGKGLTYEEVVTKYAQAKAETSLGYQNGTIDVYHLMACFELVLGHFMKIKEGVDFTGIE